MGLNTCCSTNLMAWGNLIVLVKNERNDGKAYIVVHLKLLSDQSEKWFHKHSSEVVWHHIQRLCVNGFTGKVHSIWPLHLWGCVPWSHVSSGMQRLSSTSSALVPQCPQGGHTLLHQFFEPIQWHNEHLLVGPWKQKEKLMFIIERTGKTQTPVMPAILIIILKRKCFSLLNIYNRYFGKKLLHLICCLSSLSVLSIHKIQSVFRPFWCFSD